MYSDLYQYSIEAKQQLQKVNLDPAQGISCLNRLKQIMHSLSERQQQEILSFPVIDKAIDRLLEKYVSQPEVKLAFSVFVMAHLNIFIDELMLIQSQSYASNA